MDLKHRHCGYRVCVYIPFFDHTLALVLCGVVAMSCVPFLACVMGVTTSKAAITYNSFNPSGDGLCEVGYVQLARTLRVLPAKIVHNNPGRIRYYNSL